MEASKSQTTVQVDNPALHLNKSLLPIEEYAGREGLSRGIVESCGKSGIVQIRKYKGKTYVVDVPVSPYLYASGTSREQKQPLGCSARPGRPTGLGRNVTSHRPGALKDPSRPVGQSEHIEDSLKASGKAAPKPRCFADKPAAAGQSAETKRPSESASIELDDEFRFRVLAAQAGSARIWQAASVLSFLFVFASVVVSAWLYMDRKVQIERLDSAYASVTRVHQDFLEARGQIASLGRRAAGSGAELARARFELKQSAAQISALRAQLAEARRDIKIVRKHNRETLRQLDEQIKNLTDRLNELTQR